MKIKAPKKKNDFFGKKKTRQQQQQQQRRRQIFVNRVFSAHAYAHAYTNKYQYVHIQIDEKKRCHRIQLKCIKSHKYLQ